MACRRSRVRLPLSPQWRLKWGSFAEVAQLVEHQLPKLRVAGSSPVFRSKGLDGSGRRRQPLFFDFRSVQRKRLRAKWCVRGVLRFRCLRVRCKQGSVVVVLSPHDVRGSMEC